MLNRYTIRANMEHWDKSKHTFFNLGIRRHSSTSHSECLYLRGGGGVEGLAVIAFLDNPQKYSSDYVRPRNDKGKY